MAVDDFRDKNRTFERLKSKTENEILALEFNQVRVAVLNRPKQLNALSHSMIKSLKKLYEQWENDSQVSLIIIKGSGRAFCAGGDVAETALYGNSGNYNLANDFFYDEYQLNYLVGTFKKPHVALLDGIVMGGGTGISIHGHIKIATEKTVFAMPETALGLHPDVGASHFLSRLPGYLGEYAGLTGARLDGADVLACGLATHFVPSKTLQELEEALHNFSGKEVEDVISIVDQFASRVKLTSTSPLYKLKEIDKCFSKTTVEDILKALELEGDNCNGWYKSTADMLRKASPLSLKVTLRSIREGRHQSLGECLMREYRSTVRFVERKLSNDFYEGVRAILMDKDRNPKWNPPSLDGVSSDLVDSFFSPLSNNEAQELQLSTQRKSSCKVNAKL